MNRDPRLDDIAQQRRDLVKPAATRALMWLFVEKGVNANIKSIEPFNTALHSISHSTHPIDILVIEVEVSADTFNNLNDVTHSENYTVNEDGSISLTIFAKMSTPEEAIDEVKGAYIIKQVDPQLCAIEYIYPPTDALPEDLPRPANASKMILSIYDSELRTMGQVLDIVFSRSPKHIEMLFENIAKLHGNSIVHGDLFLRNVSIKPEAVQFLDTAYVEFMAPRYMQRLYELMVGALKSQDDPKFFEFVELINKASSRIPVLGDFTISLDMTKEEAFKNFQRRAYLYDIERLFSSKELVRLNQSVTSNLVKVQYRIVIDKAIQTYLTTLSTLYPEIVNRKFTEAVLSLTRGLFE